MPNLLICNGYRFHFFSNEGIEPPHIHVNRGRSEAKFWLKDGSLAYNDGFKHNEMRKIHTIVQDNKAIFREKWYEYKQQR